MKVVYSEAEVMHALEKYTREKFTADTVAAFNVTASIIWKNRTVEVDITRKPPLPTLTEPVAAFDERFYQK